MILAATGHRPPKLGGYHTPNFVFDQVIAATTRLLRTLQPELVISGMALGFDQWVAEICADLGIPFDAAVPFHGYESRWIDESKRDFNRLLQQAHCVHYITNTREYSPALLHRRNRWMVDHCDEVMACYNDGPTGGTASCVRYAQEKNKTINRVILASEVWAEAARIEQQLEARRAARELQRNAPPAPIFAFRHAEQFPSGVPSSMPAPPELPPVLPPEVTARILGAQMAQEYTSAIHQMVGDVRAERTPAQILEDILDESANTPPPAWPEGHVADADVERLRFLMSVDRGVPGADRTVIAVVPEKKEQSKENERENFKPGRLIDVDE